MGSWTSLPWGTVGVRELSGNVGWWAGSGGCSQLSLGPLGEGVGEIRRVVGGAVGVGHPAESAAATVQRLPGGHGCGRPRPAVPHVPRVAARNRGGAVLFPLLPFLHPVPPWHQTDWGGILVLPRSSRVDAGPDSGAPSSHLRRGNCEHRPTAPGAGWTPGKAGPRSGLARFPGGPPPSRPPVGRGTAVPSHLFAGGGGLAP